MMYNNKTDVLQKNIADLRAVHEEKISTKDHDPLWDVQMDSINQAIDVIEEDIKRDNAYNNAKRAVEGIEVKSAKIGHIERKHLSNYLRKGVQPDGSMMGMANGMSLDKSNGAKIQISSSKGVPGYSATYSIADSIYEYLKEYSVMRRLCSSILVSRDSLDMPMTQSDISCIWESGTTIAPETTPMIMNSIKTHELTAQPKVTQKMIDDTVIDLESWLVEKLAAMFLVAEDKAFIAGTGTNEPKGILSYAEPTGNRVGIRRVKSGAASTFDERGLLQLHYSLDDYYAVNSAFIMNKATLQAIRTFKDSSTGQYYWMPGVLFGKADTLLGSPVYTSGHVPTVGAGKDIILYGDMKRAYQIVDRSEITIQRDPYSSKPFVVFYATKRVGGDLIEPEAVRVLKVAA